MPGPPPPGRRRTATLTRARDLGKPLPAFRLDLGEAPQRSYEKHVEVVAAGTPCVVTSCGRWASVRVTFEQTSGSYEYCPHHSWPHAR